MEQVDRVSFINCNDRTNHLPVTEGPTHAIAADAFTGIKHHYLAHVEQMVKDLLSVNAYCTPVECLNLSPIQLTRRPYCWIRYALCRTHTLVSLMF